MDIEDNPPADALTVYQEDVYLTICIHFITLCFEERLDFYIYNLMRISSKAHLTDETFLERLYEGQATRLFLPKIYDKAATLWNQSLGRIREEGTEKLCD